MCPDWGLNLQPFGAWDSAPSNRATWPGHNPYILNDTWLLLQSEFFRCPGIPKSVDM